MLREKEEANEDNCLTNRYEGGCYECNEGWYPNPEDTIETEKPETPEQPAAPEEQTSTEQPVAPEQEEVNIVVQHGMSSDTVSQVLADHGVISDWKDFNRYLETNNYGNRIQPGNFTVPKNASYEDLARILSKSR